MNRDVITLILSYCPAKTIVRYCATRRGAKNTLTHIKFDHKNPLRLAIISTKILNPQFLKENVAKYIFTLAWNRRDYMLVFDMCVISKAPFDDIIDLAKKREKSGDEMRMLRFFVDDRNARFIANYNYKMRPFMRMAHLILNEEYDAIRERLTPDRDTLRLLCSIYDDIDENSIDYYEKIANPIFHYIEQIMKVNLDSIYILANYGKINILNQLGADIPSVAMIESGVASLIEEACKRDLAVHGTDYVARSLFLYGNAQNDSALTKLVYSDLKQIGAIVVSIIEDYICGNLFRINTEMIYLYCMRCNRHIYYWRYFAHLFDNMWKAPNRAFLMWLLSSGNLPFEMMIELGDARKLKKEFIRMIKLSKLSADYEFIRHIGEYCGWHEDIIAIEKYEAFLRTLEKQMFF